MTTTPDYSGTAVTVRVAEHRNTFGDIGLWRNQCPVDCGWHGSDHEGRGTALNERDEEAKGHQCLRTGTEESQP
jgi:hypothetical protein